MSQTNCGSTLIPRRTTRESRIAFRATPSEVAHLKAQSESNGLSISQYLRMAVGQEQSFNMHQPTRPELKTAARIVKVSSGLTYLLRLCEGRKITIEEIKPVINDIQAAIMDLTYELRGVKP